MTAMQRNPLGKLALSFLGLGILVTFISATWRNNLLIFITLVMAFGLVLFHSKRKRSDMIAFLVGMVLGPTMEIIIIHYGAWQYANPSAAGIPMWLPLLWGLTSIFLLKITRWFAE